MGRNVLITGYRLWAAATVATVALSGCSKSGTAQAGGQASGAAQGRGRGDGRRLVQVEQVRQDRVHRAVEVVGTLAAQDEVTISSQTEGAVSRILADLGDRVRMGEVLIELDREKPQYNLDQQKAALARALAKYGAADTGHLPPIEQTPDVQKAQAELVQARQAYTRAEELNKRQLVPKQALDDAEAMLHSKQASYDSALQSAKNLGADIDASNAVMKLADRQLRDTSIRAPLDGYVQRRMVSLGEFVKAQTPVISVVRVDPLKVIGEIPERLGPWIEVGRAVDLRVDAFPDNAIAGTISRISPAVNTQTRAFAFEGRVPNPGALLKPGTFARVHIESTRIDQVLTLPYAALQYRYGVNRVFVVTNDTLGAHELKLGDRLGDRVEILGGVNAGDRVAITDVDNLADGMKVTVGRETQ
jgi:multidrug efflux pump subunit AcrA (membrane-fusion protein)